MPEPDDDLMLRLSDITVRFGGIAALGGLSFDARTGRGARDHRPERCGQDDALRRHLRRPRTERGTRASSPGATSLEVEHRRAPAAGLRRTFQRVQPFGWLTVEDNVLAALEWRGGGGGFVADLVVLPHPPPA